MSVTQDIAATYRGPRTVFRRLLAMGRREDRALIFVLLGCLLIFVAQAPWQARVAHLDPEVPLQARLYWSAFFWIFIVPLLLYLIAFASHLAAKAMGGRGKAYGARLALFWALLSVSPLVLLAGLVAAMVGSGPGLQFIGLLGGGAFFWIWISNLREAEWSSE